MGFADQFSRVFRSVLPTPFTIAILLTAVTFVVAFFFSPQNPGLDPVYFSDLLGYWDKGLWNPGLLVFAFQMMLMLVLGHVLALTRPVAMLIGGVTRYCTDTPRAAMLVTLLTVLVSLFNWGLGLVFGAIFARKVAEHAAKHALNINYPLIGAAGYSGLMVWHGGISGSSLIKVAEPGNLKQMMGTSAGWTEEQLATLPETLTFGETVFSNLNLFVIAAVVVLLPLLMFWLGKRVKSEGFSLPSASIGNGELSETDRPSGAERLDRSVLTGKLVGAVIIGYCGFKFVDYGWPLDGSVGDWTKFFIPNNINLLLLGLCLTLHRNIRGFLGGVEEAIGGAAGILIQFPLYFGIMGVFTEAGLVSAFSEWIASNTNAVSYPIYTFFSSGVVNVFIPSGGGQWAVQGPIIVESATNLGIPLHKAILSVAYGDQLTNMLQPFWALPLLAITGLKAKQILPYTLVLLLAGIVIFVGALMIF